MKSMEIQKKILFTHNIDDFSANILFEALKYHLGELIERAFIHCPRNENDFLLIDSDADLHEIAFIFHIGFHLYDRFVCENITRNLQNKFPGVEIIHLVDSSGETNFVQTEEETAFLNGINQNKHYIKVSDFKSYFFNDTSENTFKLLLKFINSYKNAM